MPARADRRLEEDASIAEEDRLRAEVYDILSALLRREPEQPLLDAVARLDGDGTPFGSAVTALSRIAGRTEAATARREYVDLFIGLGRGELVPFASYYLTGFLNEKPLAVLRQDMAALGVARAEESREPEDHIASLCEIMAGLILGRFAEPAALDVQRRFFARHLAPWAKHFFSDLEGADASVLYAPVGTVGRLFMEIEAAAFEMEE